MGVMSKLLYCNIEKLKLAVTDKPTIVYFSSTRSKNVYKAHALIQETVDGDIIKKVYF